MPYTFNPKIKVLSEAREIINFSVESLNDSSRVKKFYEKFYVKRNNEDETFHDFLESSSPLLFITGHVGTGKSTFIRQKMQYAEPCQGIIINMREHVVSNREADHVGNLRGNILNMLKRIYLQAGIDRLKNNINKGTTFKLSEFSIEDFSLGPITDSLSEEYNAKFVYAFIALYNLNSLRKFASDNDLLDKVSTKDNLRAFLNGKYRNIDRVLELISVPDVIHLYRLVFENDDLVHCLCVDNYDAVLSSNSKSIIADLLVELVQELNGFRSYYKFKKMYKVIFCIRNENITRANITDGATVHSWQLSFASGDYVLPRIIHFDELLLNDTLCYSVIEKRLNIFRLAMANRPENEKLEGENYIRLVNSLWLDEREKKINPSVVFDIAKFSNGSIRLALELINDAVTNILNLYHSVYIEDDLFDDLYPYAILKGTFFKCLTQHAYTHNLLDSFKGSIKNEIKHYSYGRERYCCLYRLILIYLTNKNEKVEVQNLVQRFSQVFQLYENEIKEALFNLYANDHYEGALVSIMQSTPIFDANSIDVLRAKIKVTPKGKIFIEKLLIQFDFYGYVFSEEGRQYKTIFEMKPYDAQSYCKLIIEKLWLLQEKHVNVYRQALRNLNIKPRRDAAEVYGEEFCYTSSLHLERVCDSSRNTIKQYIIMVLTKNNQRLILSEQDISEFKSRYCSLDKYEIKPEIHDFELEKIINLEIESSDPIAKIWKSYNDLAKIKGKMISERLRER